MKPVVCVYVVGSPMVLVAPDTITIRSACTCVSIVAAILYRSGARLSLGTVLPGMRAWMDVGGRDAYDRVALPSDAQREFVCVHSLCWYVSSFSVTY